MDARQLRYFVQIVESGSLAKASRQLFIAQPALSHHVTRLEDEVGKPLLLRSSRGVTPTDHGAALYQHAKFVLRQLEDSVAVARQEPGALTGRVTASSTWPSCSRPPPPASWWSSRCWTRSCSCCCRPPAACCRRARPR